MLKYKFLKLVRGKIKSDSGNTTWKIGEWQKQDGAIKLWGDEIESDIEFIQIKGRNSAIIKLVDLLGFE